MRFRVLAAALLLPLLGAGPALGDFSFQPPRAYPTGSPEPVSRYVSGEGEVSGWAHLAGTEGYASDYVVVSGDIHVNSAGGVRGSGMVTGVIRVSGQLREGRGRVDGRGTVSGLIRLTDHEHNDLGDVQVSGEAAVDGYAYTRSVRVSGRARVFGY